MTDLIVFLVTGLAFGSVYALAASGLVLTYSTSGIFNFAHGAFAMLGAFIYWQMTEGWGWPSPIAFLIVLGVVGPFFGAVVERGIMRGLQGTSETTRLMVSVSLLLGSLGLGQVIWETAPRRLPLLFDGAQAFRVAGYNVSWHQVATVIFAAGAAGALWLLLTRSRLGISMRSVVDDRNLARLAGARPDNAAIAAWAIGASMAALAGILTTGGRTLSHFELILLVVNAYAAAMVGRLSSLPRTFAGAVMLGLFDSFIQVYIKAAFPDAAWPESLRGVAAVLLLFGVLLFLRPPELKTLGITRSREIVPDPSYQKVLIGCAAFGAVVFVLGTAVFDISDKTAMAGGIGYGIIMLSLVPLAGYGGQISLAQFAFAGLGAVTMAYFGNGGSIFGLPVPTFGMSPTVFGLVMAAILPAFAGALVALPALRLSGLYLALATMAFAVFVEKFFMPQLPIMGGGSTLVPRLELPGLSLQADTTNLMVQAVIFTLMALGVVWIRKGPFGRRLQAMKDSPAACATLGLDLTRTKLSVFALSAGMAGVGGALYFGTVGNLSISRLTVVDNLNVLLMAVVGGVTSVAGPLFGGMLLGSFPIIRAHGPGVVNDLLLVLPGLIGISLGRNPNGAVNEIGRNFRELTVSSVDADDDTPPEVIPEQIGIDRGFTDGELAEINARIDLDGVRQDVLA